MEYEKVKIGGIIFGEQNMPVAVLEDSQGVAIGYLTPFRGYSFQVSGSLDGAGDLGSSQVIGLGNVLHVKKGEEGSQLLKRSNLNWDETNRDLLKGQAALALLDFIRSEYIYVRSGSGEYTTSYSEKVWCNDILDFFIIEVVHYLNEFEKTH